MMDQETEERLARLVNRDLFDRSAHYHAQVETFRRWLAATQMALEDEGVPPDTIRRVLNRLVYAHPDGSAAYERIDLDARARDLLMKGVNTGTTAADLR